MNERKARPPKKYPEELAMAISRLNSAAIRDLPLDELRAEVKKLREKYKRYD